MKKQFSFLLTALLLIGFFSVNAQLKVKSKDLKAMKEARKQAKKLKKQGWNVAPGALPLEKSLESSWSMLLERDDEGVKKYLDADGNAVSETKTAADLQALEMAKLNLAGQLETEIAALVEASIANEQLTREEAASVTKVVTGSKHLIATTIKRVDPVYKVYREVGKSNVEVQLKLFYNLNSALNTAKQTLRNKLSEETEIIHEKLDKMLKLDDKATN
ncbi:MAG: hypothetical protein ACPGJS_00200 [Flammeovirgaceae bacterium]